MLQILVVLLFICATLAAPLPANIFEIDVVDSKGNTVSLSTYQDAKAILIVNVASKCGYTYTNYVQLREMYELLHDRGLEILAFPSNQFGNQEPGSGAEIQEFCGGYGISFPVFSKIEVNGPNSHPLYKYLKKKTGGTEIGWNFFKILVVDGVPVQRYPAAVKPKEIIPDLLKYLTPGGDDSSAGSDEL